MYICIYLNFKYRVETTLLIGFCPQFLDTGATHSSPRTLAAFEGLSLKPF